MLNEGIYRDQMITFMVVFEKNRMCGRKFIKKNIVNFTAAIA